MRFLNPLLIAGLALVLVPLVIHLINRRKATRRPIPTIEFLLRSENRLARRLKLKQLLLLLLRVGIFVLLPLAMARPYFLSDEGLTETERLPAAVVLVLDMSYSMGQQSSGTTLFELAKGALLEELESLRTWDRVALVLAQDPPLAAVDTLSEDRGPVQRAIRRLSGPVNTTSDLPAALALAREIHSHGQLPVRRTVVFSDMAAHAWEASELAPEQLAHLGDLQIRELAEPDPELRANVAIVDGGFRESRTGGEGSYEIWARVHNYSERERSDLRLDLYVEERLVGSSTLRLPPAEGQISQFTIPLDGGSVKQARFQLQVEDNDLLADNEYHITLHLNRQVRVLLVNGDPRSVAYRDELFFLEHALNTGPDDPSAITTTTVGVEGLTLPLPEVDVVVLANVSNLPRTAVAELLRFVRNGGGILLTMGERVQPEVYNLTFAELLPKPLRSLRELCHRNDPDANLMATRVARISAGHPAFRVFDLPGGESLQSVRVFSYMLLEPSPRENVETLISYGDGGPALVEREIGSGRVALLTTSIDRDWTDWPIRTAYLPMVRRLMRYLARQSIEADASPALVGQRFLLDLETQRPERVLLVDPEGGRYVLEPLTVGAMKFSFRPARPGPHEVYLTISGNERAFEELRFSANLDPGESDLGVVEEELLDSYRVAAAGAFDGGSQDVPERRRSIWPLLLFLLVLVLFLEAGISLRRRSWSVLRERWQRFTRLASPRK